MYLEDKDKLKKIVEAIKEVTGVNIKTAKGRKQNIADAKKIYFYIAKRNTKMTCQFIAKYLRMDHASSIHGYKKCSDLLEYDEDFKRIFNKVFKKVSFVYTMQDYRDAAAKAAHEYRDFKRKAEALSEIDEIKNNLKIAS